MTDLLKPNYTEADEAYRDEMRSRHNIASAIIDARIARGLTHAEIADLAGTLPSRVVDLEAMRANPGVNTLARVARALGLVVTLAPRGAA